MMHPVRAPGTASRVRRALVLALPSAALAAAATPRARAHEHEHEHEGGHGAAARAGGAPGTAYAALSPLRCADASLACASAATPAWAPDGSLWLAWVAGGAVSVARSRDAGATFAAPVVIGRHGAYADVGPDARPQIAVGADGRIAVVYDVFKDESWNARVLAATSSDGGATFSAPRAVSDDPASQRFPAIVQAGDGALFVAWVDKRRVAAAARRGHRQPGASIAYARSDDMGGTFSASRIAYPQSCECCRIGLAVDASRQPVLLFRAIFGRNVRDHGVVAFGARGSPGPLHRVADDHWAIDACPHHGPALAIAADGSYHAVWFTQGSARSGVFYACSRDGGRTFSAPMHLGSPARRISRPYVLAEGTRVWLAWKEFDGELATVHAQVSTDTGARWSTPREVARTGGYSDHPLLTAHAGKSYLSWQTQAEGYRLLPLEDR